MFRLSRIFWDFEESGALNAYVSLYGFWDEQMVITKAGDLALAVKVQGVDYECLDSAARDYVTKRLESAFRVFDGKLRLYQVVFKENRPEIPWPEHENPVVNTTLQNRRHHFEGKADSLFEIEIYFVFLYEGFRYRTGLLHALPKLAQSPAAALRSGGKAPHCPRRCNEWRAKARLRPSTLASCGASVPRCSTNGWKKWPLR